MERQELVCLMLDDLVKHVIEGTAKERVYAIIEGSKVVDYEVTDNLSQLEASQNIYESKLYRLFHYKEIMSNLIEEALDVIECYKKL